MAERRFSLPLLLWASTVILSGPLLVGCENREGGASEETPSPSFADAMRERRNPPRAEVIALGIADTTLEVEVAGEGIGLTLGLMFRDRLGPDEGMWFEFPEEDFRQFWMKDTKVPLSIAFVDRGGRISNIEDMVPYDETHVRSRNRVRYALEMNRGWFAKKGVRAGDSIRVGRKRKIPALAEEAEAQ